MTKSFQPSLQLLPQHLWNDGNAVHTVIKVVGKFLLLMSWEVGACSSPANMNKMMMMGGGDDSNDDISQYCGARNAKDCGIFFNFKGSGFVCKRFILNAGVSM